MTMTSLHHAERMALACPSAPSWPSSLGPLGACHWRLLPFHLFRRPQLGPLVPQWELLPQLEQGLHVKDLASSV